MAKKALVLSSGGVDSTTCVGIAVNRLEQKMFQQFLYSTDRNTIRNWSVQQKLQSTIM